MRKLSAAVDRFAYNHPRFGIPNLMKFIVIGNVLVYLLSLFAGYGAVSFLNFQWAAITHGELWRLITFIFMPGYYSTGDVLWLALFLYFYYMIGTVLEREWGTAKFTLYYFSGVVLTLVVGIVTALVSGHNVLIEGTSYVNLSMFFAFAMLYPETQFLVFFIIPVKVKWLAWIDAAYFALAVLQYLLTGHFLYALIPIVAVLNYLLFFAADIGSQFSYWKGRAKNRARQNQYRQAYNHPGSGPKVVNFHDAKTKTKTQYLHKCAVCGKTDLTDPQMEFRYCSRCNGYYCYCADHINNHIHIQ